MRGRLADKKGSSLIAVMTTMAVLSIIVLCAAGIALTNFMTTRTYTSQDNYFYSAQAGQTQFVANLNDVAYNSASGLAWSDKNYKTSATTVYEEVIASADGFNEALKENTYNGKYKVSNKIVSSSTNESMSECYLTIETTVTKTDEGITQTFTSVVTIKCPVKDGEEKVTNNNTALFNDGYVLVATDSAKNTPWYGLWGNLNTYTTNKNGTAPYFGNGTTTSEMTGSWNSEGKIFTTVFEASNVNSSGIYMKAGIDNNIDELWLGDFVHHFNYTESSINNNNSEAIGNLLSADGIEVDVTGIIAESNNMKDINKMVSSSTKELTLKYSQSATPEKYYIKYDGYVDKGSGRLDRDFTISFDQKPGVVSLSSVSNVFNSSQPSYRVVCDSSGTKFGISYYYPESSSRGGSTYSYTYADHYYKNKWFFVDLEKADGTFGTLLISNTTSTKISANYQKNPAQNTISAIWLSEASFTDEWNTATFASKGNIVMEDCYFFVNGNVYVGNGFNFSDCKVFATGNITLGMCNHMEGLLSLETNAGSDVIKQSLYYSEGYFKSELVSRYASSWIIHNTGNRGSNPEWYQYNPSGTGSSISIPSNLKDCVLSNENTYQMVSSGCYTDGYLATYRYPSVLKATIVAKGTLSYNDAKYLKCGVSYTDMAVTSGYSFSYLYDDGCGEASVILYPKVMNSSNKVGDGVVQAVLIEGQVFASGTIYTINHNGYKDSTNSTQMHNRYAASSQIQYQPYTANEDFGGIIPSWEDVFDRIKDELGIGSSSSSTSYTYSGLVVENSGIYKKQ